MSEANRRLSWMIGALLLFPGASTLSQSRLTSTEVSIGLDKNSITEHEPVILDIRIQGPLSTSLDFDPGYDWENVDIKVVDPDGRLQMRPSQISREGMKFSNAVHIEAGAVNTISVVASDWFSFAKQGLYQIEVALRGVPSPSVSTRLSLLVEEKDENALKAACSALLDRVNNSQSFSASLVAAQALSDVNDSTAVPYLAAAMKRREFVSLMIDALSRLNTEDAINALIEASRSNDRETSGRAHAALVSLRHAKEQSVVSHGSPDSPFADVCLPGTVTVEAALLFPVRADGNFVV